MNEKEVKNPTENEILADQLQDVPISEKTKAELKDLTPSVQQFLIRFMDVRDLAIENKIMKTMEKIHIADNDDICRNVSLIVTGQTNTLFEMIQGIAKSVEAIATDINNINESIKSIDYRLKVIEIKQTEHESRIGKLEKKVGQIEGHINQLKREVKILKGK